MDRTPSGTGCEVIHHLPGLAHAGEESVAALDGCIARLTFEEFEQLEDDWAHENYFDQHTTVWRAQLPAQNDVDQPVLIGRESARLIQLAASAVCEKPLPDPSLSMLYCLMETELGRGYRKAIGPYERTWLLSQRAIAAPEPGQWQEIAALAQEWRAGGLSAESAVFMPLQAYGSVVATLASQPALMTMPVVVALEGLFAPGKAHGIAQRITANVARVLPDAPDLEQRVKDLYAIRSDIIHGRPFDAEQAGAALATAGWLACRATRALASAMAQAKSRDLRAIYGGWA